MAELSCKDDIDIWADYTVGLGPDASSSDPTSKSSPLNHSYPSPPRSLGVSAPAAVEDREVARPHIDLSSEDSTDNIFSSEIDWNNSCISLPALDLSTPTQYNHAQFNLLQEDWKGSVPSLPSASRSNVLQLDGDLSMEISFAPALAPPMPSDTPFQLEIPWTSALSVDAFNFDETAGIERYPPHPSITGLDGISLEPIITENENEALQRGEAITFKPPQSSERKNCNCDHSCVNDLSTQYELTASLLPSRFLTAAGL